MVDVSPVRSAPPDAEIARATARWKEKVDAALGEEIGWAGAGLDKESVEIGRWITEAWRDGLGTEVAVVNRTGIRQGLPRGAVSLASVWSVLPFDNKLMRLTMAGSALARTLDADGAVVGGASRDRSGKWTVGGAPLEAERLYSVATIDFLYQGGHLGLQGAPWSRGHGHRLARPGHRLDPEAAFVEGRAARAAAPLTERERPSPHAATLGAARGASVRAPSAGASPVINQPPRLRWARSSSSWCSTLKRAQGRSLRRE